MRVLTNLFYISVIFILSLSPFVIKGDELARINIRLVTPWIEKEALYLNIQSDLSLSTVQINSLKSGIPLTFFFTIELEKYRQYLPNKSILEQEIKFTLRYHPLSNQYIVKSSPFVVAHSKSHLKMEQAFPSLNLALNHIGNIKELNVGNSNLIKSSTAYEGTVRFKLGISDLPIPMQFDAYFSSDWELKSKPTKWFIYR